MRDLADGLRRWWGCLEKGWVSVDGCLAIGDCLIGMDVDVDAHMTVCGPNSKPLKKDPTAFLDQNTSFVVDNQYYNQLLLKKGILQIDQELTLDNSTAGLVAGFGSDGVGFLEKFASAMLKMGSIEVLVGNAGEIRTNCRAFNPPR